MLDEIDDQFVVDDVRGDSEFKPPSLRREHVELEPVAAVHHSMLQWIETVGPPAPRWWHRGTTPSSAQFANMMNDPLANFLVFTTADTPEDRKPPIGRVFSYRPNFQDRYAYFAAVSFKPNERSPLMMLGVGIFLRYTFWNWDFQKLYMEVPEYNFSQFESGAGRFFEIEGRLRGHSWMGGRTWDQLILALYRDTAELQAALLHLDEPRRPPTTARVRMDSGPMKLDTTLTLPQAAMSWEEFVAEIARIAQVPATDVHEETRVLEDLAVDSLELAELSVVLVDKYGSPSLSRQIESRSWKNLTVRALYDEYLSGTRPGHSANAPSKIAGLGRQAEPIE